MWARSVQCSSTPGPLLSSVWTLEVDVTGGESLQDGTQRGRAGQGGKHWRSAESRRRRKKKKKGRKRKEKRGKWRQGSCLWTSWEGCWYSPEGLWGIFKLQGWGSLIAAVFLDHFWKEYKNVVSKSGQEANGYRRGETVSFSRTLTRSPG